MPEGASKKKEKGVVESWVECLAEMPEALPEVEGYGYKYTPLPTILNAVRPILAKHGFAIGQTWDYLENRKVVEIRTTIYHKTGVWRTYKAVLPLLNTGKGNVVQAVGATITYGRRYQVSAILGLATEEDTGAAEPTREEKKPTEKPIEKKPTKKPSLDKSEAEKLINEALAQGKIDKTIHLNWSKALAGVQNESGLKAFTAMVRKFLERAKPVEDVPE